MLLVGSQISQDSLLTSLQHAIKQGANVAQVFLRDMSSASPKARIQLSSSEIQKIRAFIEKHQLQVFFHASYLLHFCRQETGQGGIRWAYQILREDMGLAEQLGIRGAVLHMCSTKRVSLPARTLKETETSMVDHIQYFLSQYGHEFPHVTLLLENSAGEHSRIGKHLKELGAVYKPLHRMFPHQVGICIDTCHAFAAGYPIHSLRGWRSFWTTYKKEIGPLSSLHLIHLNDSAHPLASKKDRHIGLGQGYLFPFPHGKKILHEIVRFSAQHSIPLCLETHGNYKKEISLLRSLFQTGGARRLSLKKVISHLQEIQEYHTCLGHKREADQYQKILSSLRRSSLHFVRQAEDLQDLPFLGKGTMAKVNELLHTGKIQLLEDFRKDKTVQAMKILTTLFDVGPITAKKWVAQHIYSLSDLQHAVDQHQIQLTPSQKVGLAYHSQLQQRLSRPEAEAFQKHIEKRVKSYDKKAQVILAGSYRTGKTGLGDLDVVVGSSKHLLKPLVEELVKEGVILDALKGSLIPKEDQDVYMGVAQLKKKVAHVDLHRVDEKELPYYLLYFGSGKEFSRRIRQHAKTQGYRLTQRFLWDLKHKKALYLPSEEAIFAFLGLEYVVPTQRID